MMLYPKSCQIFQHLLYQKEKEKNAFYIKIKSLTSQTVFLMAHAGTLPGVTDPSVKVTSSCSLPSFPYLGL